MGEATILKALGIRPRKKGKPKRGRPFKALKVVPPSAGPWKARLKP